MDNLICGFIKVRNEILRGSNLYRAIRNLQEYCDDIFVCDDASYDGTYEYLKTLVSPDHILRVPPEEHDFQKELYWKEKLLQMVHAAGPWEYIWWLDGDEVLDREGTNKLREFCREQLNTEYKGYSFHYTQLWRNTSWARTDEGFDDGCFIKLWKYTPELSFQVEHGTHRAQFPAQILDAYNAGLIAKVPCEIIHYGNAGINLRWKCIQYFGGLGGVDRHLRFPNGTYREVSPETFPEHCDLFPGPKPEPFTDEQIQKILELKDLKGLEKTFCIILPTYNRADTLPRALDSLIGQTYQRWVCFVLDDGSSDNTEEVVRDYVERDPRIFYVKYLDRRGGVAMNEVGMEIAVNTAEWWVRLGSDDWFMPDKLENDFQAFTRPTHYSRKIDALYGPFVVHRKGVFNEMGNMPVPSDQILPGFIRQGFCASWANCAVRTDVLRKVKEKFGNYCDPSLRNMEDRLVNFRIAKITDWVYRGKLNGELLIDPLPETFIELAKDQYVGIEADGVWNAAETGGASSPEAAAVYSKDSFITTQIIEREKDL